MTTTWARAVAWGRQAVLTVGAVLGVVCLLVAAGSALVGLRPLVFRSGSMSPTIETGALALAREVDAAQLRVGDVVSVPTGGGERVTHRIVRVTHRDGAATLALRGDANEAPDARAYVVESADRVLLDVPMLGYVVSWVVGPAGLFLLGLYAAFLLSVLLRPGARDADDPPDPDDEGGSPGPDAIAAPDETHPSLRRTTVAMGLTLLVASVLPLPLTPTLAAWTNPASVTGTSLAAYTVPPPGTATCTPGGTTTTRTVAYRWSTSTSPALSYSATVTGITGATSGFVTAGGSTTMTISYPTAGNSTRYATATVRGSLQSTPSWASGPTTFRFRTGATNGLAQCGETSPPTLTFRAPDATTRTVANERAYVSSAAGCVYPGIVVCGFRSDASTMTSVEYLLQRTQGGLTQCWNGTGWSTGACGGYQAASMDVYQGQTVWYDTGDVNAAYGVPGPYALTVRVTDEWGNVGTSAVSFTLT